MPIARARLGGQARTKKCSAATLSRIGRQGGRAAAKALTPDQRREKASRAGKAANRSRWGWADYKLLGVPPLSYRSFQILAGIEKSAHGMYPVKAWRAFIAPDSDGEGFGNIIFRRLFEAGYIVRTGNKSPYGRPLYVITQAGRDVLVEVRALIVEARP